ncbi:hypothetical protein PMAYCL1PPCAC_16658, partial [Pristionchus mayeri]
VSTFSFQFSIEMIAPSTISNYFNVTRVSQSTFCSDPPYIGWPFAPDRVFGGILVSQVSSKHKMTLTGDITFLMENVNVAIFSQNYNSTGFKLSRISEGNVAFIHVYQNEKLIGIGHVRVRS